jgi:hypothetical protein
MSAGKRRTSKGINGTVDISRYILKKEKMVGSPCVLPKERNKTSHDVVDVNPIVHKSRALLQEELLHMSSAYSGWTRLNGLAGVSS